MATYWYKQRLDYLWKVSSTICLSCNLGERTPGRKMLNCLTMGYKNDLIGIINLKSFICLFICRSSSSTRPGLLSSTTSGLYNSPDYKYKNTSVSSLAKAVSEIRNYSTPGVSSTYRRRRFYYWSAAVNKWYGILCVLYLSYRCG